MAPWRWIVMQISETLPILAYGIGEPWVIPDKVLRETAETQPCHAASCCCELFKRYHINLVANLRSHLSDIAYLVRSWMTFVLLVSVPSASSELALRSSPGATFQCWRLSVMTVTVFLL